LTEERIAFLGELLELDSDEARVSVHRALTPAASDAIGSLPSEVRGCVSGYFTAKLPAPGQEVLVIVFPRDESETNPSIAIAELKDDAVSLSVSAPSATLSIDELLDSSCISDWQASQAAASGSAGASSQGLTNADCGKTD
jgi:hypothetical protein